MAGADDLTIELRDDTKDEFALEDAYLLGIAWIRDPPELAIRLQTGDKRNATLRCSWPKVDVDFKDLDGIALSWGATFERDGKVWRMRFEFTPSGVIELTCSEAWLVYDEPPAVDDRPG